MRGSGAGYDVAGTKVGDLVEHMIRDYRGTRFYVCDSVTGMLGYGYFEKGRYAKVVCVGDGVEHVYRIDLHQDMRTYGVRPWVDLLDER
jgi:hypothetical protein